MEAPWRRRFSAPLASLPSWAPDNPQRLLYSSDISGKRELYAWNSRSTRHRQLTDRPGGTSHGHLDPRGEWIWWCDENNGDEFGQWRRQRFAGGSSRAATDLPAAYEAGLALGTKLAVVALSDDDGTAFNLVPTRGPSRAIYSHAQFASVEDLSRDQTLLSMTHSEHGDVRHPSLRVMTLDGRSIGELWDRAGEGWQAGP